MPTEKKVPLDPRVRPKSEIAVRPAIKHPGLDTGLPSTDALLEGAAAQTVQRAEDPAWDPPHPSRPPRTDAEAAARERALLETLGDRSRRPSAEPKDDHRDDLPPERSGPYSHGDYGVLECDNPDKPYIHRQNSPEMDSLEAMEAAERRR